MSLEENKQLVIKLFDAFNKQNISLLEEILEERYVVHETDGSKSTRNIKDFNKLFKNFIEAFPDAEYRILDLIAEKDKVVAYWEMEGIHSGTFLSINATGKKIRSGGVVIYRIVNGKIVEYWENFNTFEMLKQLGAEISFDTELYKN